MRPGQEQFQDAAAGRLTSHNPSATKAIAASSSGPSASSSSTAPATTPKIGVRNENAESRLAE